LATASLLIVLRMYVIIYISALRPYPQSGAYWASQHCDLEQKQDRYVNSYRYMGNQRCIPYPRQVSYAPLAYRLYGPMKNCCLATGVARVSDKSMKVNQI
jgi:hypothetical protein